MRDVNKKPLENPDQKETVSKGIYFIPLVIGFTIFLTIRGEDAVHIPPLLDWAIWILFAACIGYLTAKK